MAQHASSLSGGRFAVPGTLHVFNTVEAFDAADRAALLRTAAAQLWSDVHSSAAERHPSRLGRFVLLAFPDLKAFTFRYWFAFPALKMESPVTCSAVTSLHAAWPAAVLRDGIVHACNTWMQAGHAELAWLVHTPAGSDAAAEAHSLSEWASLSTRPGATVLALCDPCNLHTHPGWPLRNLLALACARWRCRALRVICVRGDAGRLNTTLSLVLDLLLPEGHDAFPVSGAVPGAVGWEKATDGHPGARTVDLRASMDPLSQAEQAIDLNLKLMRWRVFPSLDVELLSRTKCLLIGAGTLGCAVARTLLGWGVRTITLVDSGKVAFSNPVRQSLFEFEDCLDGGRPKALAAAARLQRIFPGAVARGVCLRVPMPGHPVLPAEEAEAAQAVRQLAALIAGVDQVFLLTDTRESRWLPTLMCADAGKLALNVALGFDSFVVMRHGAGVPAEAPPVCTSLGGSDEACSATTRLGCYFCADVVAPVDSTANRTLDQQCTVARPGLAPIAAALAVELAVSVLHHPDGVAAAAGSQSGALSSLPHQIRGSLSQFEQRCFSAPAYRMCTACSPTVIGLYRQSEDMRWQFLKSVFDDGTTLERLTGLSALHASAQDVETWDDDDDDDESGEDAL